MDLTEEQGAPTQTAEDRPELTVLIPAYNEARRITDSLRKMDAYLAARPYSSEILIVDDGSGDDTSSVAREASIGLTTPIRYVAYGSNRGKGYALKVGFAAARGSRILFTDSDLSTPIEETERLLAKLDEGFEMVIGTRKSPDAVIAVHQPKLREWMGKAFTFLVRQLLIDVSDVTCGFKAFEGSVGRELFALSRVHDWSFDAEILFLAHQAGRRLVEVPVYWEDQAGTKVSMLRDGIMAFLGLLRIRSYALLGRYRAPHPLGEYRELWSTPVESSHGRRD